MSLDSQACVFKWERKNYKENLHIFICNLRNYLLSFLGNEVAAIYSVPGVSTLSLKVEAYCSKTGSFLRKNSFTLPVPMTSTPKCFKTMSVFACVSLEEGMLYHFRLPAEPSDGVSAVSLDALGVKEVPPSATISPVPKMDAISIADDSRTYILSFHRYVFLFGQVASSWQSASKLNSADCWVLRVYW